MFTPALLDRITRTDILSAYELDKKVDNSFVCSLDLTAKLVELSDHKGIGYENYVHYRIDLFTRSGECILEYPMKRRLLPSSLLIAPECRTNTTVLGRVAEKLQLNIRIEFRGKGVASCLYAEEEKLYRSWGAEEIQLYAASLGRDHWRWLGYKAHCADLEMLEGEYKLWCDENDHKPVLGTPDIMKYPSEFLLSHRVKGYKMYKELI